MEISSWYNRNLSAQFHPLHRIAKIAEHYILILPNNCSAPDNKCCCYVVTCLIFTPSLSSTVYGRQRIATLILVILGF